MAGFLPENAEESDRIEAGKHHLSDTGGSNAATYVAWRCAYRGCNGNLNWKDSIEAWGTPSRLTEHGRMVLTRNGWKEIPGLDWVCPNHEATRDLPLCADAVLVRPGDTLILRVKEHVTEEEYDRLRKGVEARIPGVGVLLIGGIDQMLVYRPDETKTEQPATDQREG